MVVFDGELLGDVDIGVDEALIDPDPVAHPRLEGLRVQSETFQVALLANAEDCCLAPLFVKVS